MKFRARRVGGYTGRRLIGAMFSALLLSFTVTDKPALAQTDPLVDPTKRGGARERPDTDAPRSDDDPTSRGWFRSEPVARCPRAVTIPVDNVRLARLVDSAYGNASGAVECASLASIVARLARWPRTAGRRFEERAFDVQRAEAELQSASRQPGVRAQLDRVTRDVSHDDELRLVYEAAILDEHGFYGARDLKLRELLRHLD